MQPGPFPHGAQCAIHFGIPAPAVCARCGNFMCLTCADGGASTLCPSCRALAPAQGFPLDASASLSDFWNHLSAVFVREWLMVCLAAVVFLAIDLVGGLVGNALATAVTAALGLEIDPLRPLENLPLLFENVALSQVIGALVNLPVQGVALVGLYRVLLDVLEGRRADLGRMFSQLHLLPKYLVQQAVLFVTVTVPMLMVYGFAGFMALRASGVDLAEFSVRDVDRLFSPTVVATVGAAVAVVGVVSLVLLPVLLFAVPELMVSDCGPLEALRRGWVLGQGQRLRVIGYTFVTGLIWFAGVLACCVGFLAALPVGLLLLLSLFLALRKQHAF